MANVLFANSIKEYSCRWQREMRMVDFEISAERTALVNVDMQNCFVEGYPDFGTRWPRRRGAHQPRLMFAQVLTTDEMLRKIERVSRPGTAKT